MAPLPPKEGQVVSPGSAGYAYSRADRHHRGWRKNPKRSRKVAEHHVAKNSGGLGCTPNRRSFFFKIGTIRVLIDISGLAYDRLEHKLAGLGDMETPGHRLVLLVERASKTCGIPSADFCVPMDCRLGCEPAALDADSRSV
jgi:hypothetical protein